MKIRRLSLDGVRGLPDRELSLVDDKKDRGAAIVAVTGPQASGKTSLLEAIVAAKESIAPYGAMPDGEELVRHDASAAKIVIEWEASPIERERFGLTRVVSETIFGGESPTPDPAFARVMSEYNPETDTGKVEYFHAERSMPIGAPVELTRAAGDLLDRVSRLSSDNTKYAGLLRFLVEAGLGLDIDARGEKRPPGRVKQAFEALCGTKKLAGLYRADGQVCPGFTDAAGKNSFGITQLSASELDLLLFATSFVRAGLVQNRAGSILLVDTPERNVGEADAGALVRGLSALAGAESQLIVATRSASVIDAADAVVRLS